MGVPMTDERHHSTSESARVSAVDSAPRSVVSTPSRGVASGPPPGSFWKSYFSEGEIVTFHDASGTMLGADLTKGAGEVPISIVPIKPCDGDASGSDRSAIPARALFLVHINWDGDFGFRSLGCGWAYRGGGILSKFFPTCPVPETATHPFPAPPPFF